MKYDYKAPLEYIYKLIVNHPEDLVVRQEENDTIVNLYITANKEDYGVIIGSGGERIKNVKKILTVKAVRDGVKLNIKVDDDNSRDEVETADEEESEE